MPDQPQNNSNPIVPVPFNGQTILAQAHGDKYLVILKRLCGNMEIQYSSQFVKLQNEPWATISIIETVGADGKNRKMVAIDRKTMLMWLATINSSKLPNKHTREIVVAYQKQAAQVLDDYFGKQVDHAALASGNDMVFISQALVLAKKHLQQYEATITNQGKQIKQLEPYADYGAALAKTDGACSLGLMAKILTQAGYPTGRTRLCKQLRDEGYLLSRGRDHNTPSQKSERLGIFRVTQHKVITFTQTFTRPVTLVVPKGQLYFIERYAHKKYTEQQLEQIIKEITK